MIRFRPGRFAPDGVKAYWRVVEVVGIHQGTELTITWEGIYESEESAIRAIENAKGAPGTAPEDCRAAADHKAGRYCPSCGGVTRREG